MLILKMAACLIPSIWAYCWCGKNRQVNGNYWRARHLSIHHKCNNHQGKAMKLYGSYTSPFVRHVRIVLLETAQPFDFIETDQAGSTAKSPTQRVPFFEDGKIFLTDSLSIAKYLREKAGQDYCRSAQELDDICLVNTAMDAAVN